MLDPKDILAPDELAARLKVPKMNAAGEVLERLRRMGCIASDKVRNGEAA